VWLDWHWAVVFAGMLGIGGLVGQRSQRHAVKSASAFARETALVLGLYAVWQYAGRMSLAHVDQAFAHGRWVWDTERSLHLPSEAAFERSVLGSALVMRPLNFYYAFVHVPALIACLVWLFVFHRAHYPSLRRTLALTTAACLLIQLIPVAPPRMYPSLGFVDAAAVYGQSVYGKVGTGIADQLSAMPSVHVAWAALVALAVVVAGTSRWRFWILAHPIITIVAVTVTANHWWLDGFVAIALVLAAWGIDHAFRPVIAPLRIALPRFVLSPRSW